MNPFWRRSSCLESRRARAPSGRSVNFREGLEDMGRWRGETWLDRVFVGSCQAALYSKDKDKDRRIKLLISAASSTTVTVIACLPVRLESQARLGNRTSNRSRIEPPSNCSLATGSDLLYLAARQIPRLHCRTITRTTDRWSITTSKVRYMCIPALMSSAEAPCSPHQGHPLLQGQ